MTTGLAPSQAQAHVNRSRSIQPKRGPKSSSSLQTKRKSSSGCALLPSASPQAAMLYCQAQVLKRLRFFIMRPLYQCSAGGQAITLDDKAIKFSGAQSPASESLEHNRVPLVACQTHDPLFVKDVVSGCQKEYSFMQKTWMKRMRFVYF